MDILSDPIQFQWDEGSSNKNGKKHRVTNEECEEVFFDPHKRVVKDTFHSDTEERHILLGQTKEKRILFVVFTVRSGKIRVISARDLNKKEKRLYEEKD